MTFEITINQTLLTYLGILIIWFILPSVLDIKTHMADPKKRNHFWWALYALVISAPILILLFTLALIEKILMWVVKVLRSIANQLAKVIHK